MELNDIPMMIVQHHESDYLLKRAIDQFDRLYAEGKDRAKVMALAIHPYISGQPHRIKYLEAIYNYVNRFDGVLHWNGVQILDWYKSVAGDKLRVRKHHGSGNILSQARCRTSRTKRLTEFVTSIFDQRVVPHPRHAGEWAKMLVWANLRGTDSHGIIRIPRYIDLVNAKSINPAPNIRIEKRKAPRW